MSDSELRKAANYLQMVCADPDSPIYGSDLVARIADLTEYILGEHPADDGEPVTEEWLRVVPKEWIEDEGGFFAHGGVCIQFFDGLPRVQVGGIEGMWEHLPNTRGRVRALCKALGVPLKETP